MADTGSDPSNPGRGEQPLYAPVDVVGQAAPPQAWQPPPPQQPPPPRQPPPPDGPAPGYTAPYPPYPYDPPAANGLPENVAAGLAYVTVIPAIFFLLLEPYRRSSLVRFHSWQSIFLFVAIAVIRVIEMMLVAMLPSMIAFSIGSLFSLLFFIAWLVAVIKAFQGSRYQLPLVGAYAESTAASSSGR